MTSLKNYITQVTANIERKKCEFLFYYMECQKVTHLYIVVHWYIVKTNKKNINIKVSSKAKNEHYRVMCGSL